MKTIQYIYDCFFRAPSPYQLRRSANYKGIYVIQYNGKDIHEGTYQDCKNYLNGRSLAVSPCLYA